MASSGAGHLRTLDRRHALLVFLGLPVALVGCTRNDPQVLEPRGEASSTGSSTAAMPTPTSAPASPPTPSRGMSDAAAIELAMANLAGATLTGKQHTQLTSAQRALLAVVRAGHLDHAAALRSPEPTSRPAPTSPTSAKPGTLPPKKALAALIKQERTAASRHGKTALGSSGFEALLWTSMSVAASSYASALSAGKAVPMAPTTRRQLPSLSETDAVAELVSQLHALIYGYQHAIGKLPVVSKARARAVAELLRARILRDQLIGILTSRSAEVPVAKAAYVPSVRVHNATTAGLLIRRMQSALLPHCGLVVAAAGNPGVRRLAFDTLASTARTARSWGAPLPVWPGWQ